MTDSRMLHKVPHLLSDDDAFIMSLQPPLHDSQKNHDIQHKL
ncbi:hypothetical protein SAMN05192560_0117 [Methylobacillus rhizosphaerae]|uniref:Uncharacterized protein n=1 Tax=Methylobacillus rhizosphaerae TaxID=551994 RepID=A0A238XRB8_9PROT|nr:hypothetical protein SAMN05192560_0117 [Methylobacillus rhizosphaerae]